MSAILLPELKQRFVDNNGEALAGGKVYSYVANTTTPIATYFDQAGLTPNENPIVLDARGEADIWILNGPSYKFVITDADDVVIQTIDNVSNTLISDSPIPAGGLTGQVLTKHSDADNDFEWAAVESVPPGGTTGQVLTKASNDDGDAEWADSASEVISVFGRTGAVVGEAGDYSASDVGLGNVDNTSDLNKPVSTATQTALDDKQDTLPAGDEGDVLKYVSGAWVASPASGGGAGTLTWFSPPGSGAEIGNLDGVRAAIFPKDGGVKVQTITPVPKGFIPGFQPSIKLYSEANSFSLHAWKVTTYLVKPTLQRIDDATYNYDENSSNLGIAGDVVLISDINLTDSSGELSSGGIPDEDDVLRIVIERVAPSSGTETTEDAYLFLDLIKIKWSL